VTLSHPPGRPVGEASDETSPSRDLTVVVLTHRLSELADRPTPPQVHRDLQAAAYAAIA
jgi:hypothetical protein